MTLGEHLLETGRDGVSIRLNVEQSSPVQLRMHCEYGKARLVETKTLETQDLMVQEITMTLKNVASQSKRVFQRVNQEKHGEFVLSHRSS